ncbi:MAG: carbohydrate kinase family protein [Candidatus Paceibacterota bacterium]
MYDIITIGSATRDVFLLSKNFKTLLSGSGFGKKFEIKKAVFSTGGGSTNAATTFSRQGLKTAALFKTGSDESADYILDKIKKEKIISLAVKDKNKGSDYSTILLDSSGERTVLVHYGASSDLKISDIHFGKIKSKWAYIAPGDISFETIEKILSNLHKNKTFVAFNPSKKFIEMGLKKLKPLLDKTEVLILNLEEGSALTGISRKKEKEIFKKLDRAEKGIVVMTNGRKGVVVSDGKNIYHAGILGGRVIDRTGAGDAFGSGFVAGLIRKNSIEYAIRLGSANATSVVGKIGAKEGILTKSDFEKSGRWKNFPIKMVKA